MIRFILRPLIFLLTGFLFVLTGCELSFDTDDNPVSDDTAVYELLRWRDPDEAIDIVFMPDDDYGDLSIDSNRQAFLDDVANLIDEGLWQSNAIVSNLGAFNFWYTTNSGNVQVNNDGICPIVDWPDMSEFAFAEVQLLVHQITGLRDCRWGNRATTEPDSYRTIVHETSHAAFNLPDEYCCDGGYRSASPVLYTSENACNNDAVNAGWRNCEQIGSTGFWRSEGSIIDIMSAVGSVVVEYGPADWIIMRNVLDGLPGYTPREPDVFAPDPWDWP